MWAENLLFELFYEDALSDPKKWQNKGNYNNGGLFKLLDTVKNNLNGITAIELKKFIEILGKNKDKKISKKEILVWIRNHRW